MLGLGPFPDHYLILL